MKEVDTTRKSSRLQNSRLGKHVNNVSGTELKKCTKKKKSDLGSDSEIEKISKKVNKMPSKFFII